MIVAIIIIVITLFVDLYTDYDIWRRRDTGVRIKHGRGLWWRLAGFAPAMFSVWFFTRDLFVCGSALFFFGVWYMFFFNGIFNELRDYAWWFRGTSDPTEIDSHHERLSKRVSLQAYKIINYVLLAVSALLLSYFLITKNQ